MRPPLIERYAAKPSLFLPHVEIRQVPFAPSTNPSISYYNSGKPTVAPWGAPEKICMVGLLSKCYVEGLDNVVRTSNASIIVRAISPIFSINARSTFTLCGIFILGMTFLQRKRTTRRKVSTKARINRRRFNNAELRTLYTLVTIPLISFRLTNLQPTLHAYPQSERPSPHAKCPNKHQSDLPSPALP